MGDAFRRRKAFVYQRWILIDNQVIDDQSIFPKSLQTEFQRDDDDDDDDDDGNFHRRDLAWHDETDDQMQL